MIAEFNFFPCILHNSKQASLLALLLACSHAFAENSPSNPNTPAIPKIGFDAAGNWVDVNRVMWSKMTKGDFSYLNAKNFCKSKDAGSDMLQWQLPTSRQAESFYISAVRPKRLENTVWELGPIWTMTGGAGNNHQVADMKKGTISWGGALDFDNEGKHIACVSLPQGFDESGNYFDGKLMWSKINNKGYSRSEAVEYCEKMDKDKSWRLPSYDQLYALADTLIVRTALKDILIKHGWTLGMTYSQGNSVSLGDAAKPGNKGLATCVKRGL